jgi:hypothetical protein
MKGHSSITAKPISEHRNLTEPIYNTATIADIPHKRVDILDNLGRNHLPGHPQTRRIYTTWISAGIILIKRHSYHSRNFRNRPESVY